MKFNQVVNMTLSDRPPADWPEKISVDDFNQLDNERKTYYRALYAKYRTKKVRDYDFESGDFVGWKLIQIGIGEPIGYKYHGSITAKSIQSVMNSNVLAERIIKKDKW